MINETLTEAEFCDAVNISRVTAYRLRKAGKLPHYKLKRKVLYSSAHIEQFLTRFEINQPKDGGKYYVS